MTCPQLSPAEIDLHDATFRRGCDLVNNRILLDGKRPRLLTWFGRKQLMKAIGLFKATLELNPAGWPAMWNLGKIYQRLGDHSEALLWFRRSHELKPDHPDVAREAGLEALQIGDFAGAKVFFESAIRLNGGDPGLVANLALAQLLSGDVAVADRSASEAVAANPSDPVSRAVARVVQRVQLGKRRLPKSMVELRRLA